MKDFVLKWNSLGNAINITFKAFSGPAILCSTEALKIKQKFNI